ncbi:hypothetical protein PGB90_000640 [Kerria lacca]
MVGQIDKKDAVRKSIKIYILKEREKERLEEEAEAEKARKKKEEDEKKQKFETELQDTKDKIADWTKRVEYLQQEKMKIFEHLKKIISEPGKNTLGIEDLTKLYNMGLAITHVTTIPSQSVHPVTVPATPRASTVSVNNQYRTSSTTAVPVQAISTQKRNRSPSPFRSSYGYKQAAGPHAFQKPGNPSQSGNYSAFYSPSQNVSYTHPSPTIHSNAAVYSSYNANRENVDVLHKSQQPSVPPSSQPHSLYASHRSSLQTGPSPSLQQPNHVPYLVDHSKASQAYPDEKYYMVRPAGHVQGHGVIPIQQPSQSNKHGSITSGYPVRPVATQIGSQAQLHLQPTHGVHHSSQSSHHSSQSSHHSSQQSLHSSLSTHHSPQTHHPSSQQSQSHIQQSHHQQPSVHYAPPSSQLHHPQSQSSQQPHSSQQSSVSVQPHHSSPHHQQHIQQIHVQSHHPQASSHHQLISHHSSPSIHHTSTQQHLQQAMHHQQTLQQSQSHHQSHPQQLHHQQLTQPHIQQHISSHQSQTQGQQSQPTSVVTSQAVSSVYI